MINETIFFPGISVKKRIVIYFVKFEFFKQDSSRHEFNSSDF